MAEELYDVLDEHGNKLGRVLPKAIVFDCFGVLAPDKWKEFVSTLPESQKQPARDINHNWDSGHIDEKTFISQILELTGCNPGEVEAITRGDPTKNNQLLRYIATLKPRYKIGLLSNVASNWVREAFLSKKEQALFDTMVFSYEVHMIKPDPRIFEVVCERLGVQPNEAILIDDIDLYCEAARQTGMQAIVYQDFAQMKQALEQLLAG